MNRNYEDWLKYYENATKEQVIEDMMLDIKEISRLNNIIDEKDTEITILKNKLDMIKNNVDDLIKRKDKQTILDIIEIYTGFWGKGDDNE